MAEVVRTAPAEFIEAGAKTYLDDLTKAIGGFKTTDLSTIMGPQFVAGPGALTTQAEGLASGLGSFQPFLNEAALPTSDFAISFTPLVTFLTAFLIPPSIAGSLGTTSMMPPPMYNCLFICPLDIVII